MKIFMQEQSAAELPSHNNWLSAAEQDRLHGFRFEKRRADWRLGRWVAKCALTSYLERPFDCESLAQIEIRPTPSGAPDVFICNERNKAAISLSHRAGVAICSLAEPGATVGCDLELAEPRSCAFLSDYFTQGEQRWVASFLPEQRSLVPNLLWSAKESVLKVLEIGLRADTRDFEVELGAAAESHVLKQQTTWSPLTVRGDEHVFHGWWQYQCGLFRTVAAQPAPEVPSILAIPQTACNRF